MTTTRHRSPDTSAVPCSVWFGPIVSVSEERDFIDLLVTRHGVGVCCWPRDVTRIEHLAAAGVLRLLLVRPDAMPPAPADHQTCVRCGASHAEIHEALVRLCNEPSAAQRRSA